MLEFYIEIVPEKLDIATHLLPFHEERVDPSEFTLQIYGGFLDYQNTLHLGHF